MSVYVDTMQARFGRMVMSHMIADTTEELCAMADKIGVKRKWIQKSGTPNEHFDVCQLKRALAISNGAILISQRELAEKVRARRPHIRVFQCVGDFCMWSGGWDKLNAGFCPKCGASVIDCETEANAGNWRANRRRILEAERKRETNDFC